MLTMSLLFNVAKVRQTLLSLYLKMNNRSRQFLIFGHLHRENGANSLTKPTIVYNLRNSVQQFI